MEAGSSSRSSGTKDRTELEKVSDNVNRTNCHHLKKKSHDGLPSISRTKMDKSSSAKNKKSSIQKESTLDKKTPDETKSERTTSKIREGRSRSRSRGGYQRKQASKKRNTKQVTQDDVLPHQEDAGSPKALSTMPAVHEAGELVESPNFNRKDIEEQQQTTSTRRAKNRTQRTQRARTTTLRRSTSFSAVKARRKQPPRKMVSSSDLHSSKKNDSSRSVMKERQSCSSKKGSSDRIRRTKKRSSSRPREKKQLSASNLVVVDESVTESSTRTLQRRGRKVSDGGSPRSTTMRDQPEQSSSLMDQLCRINQLSETEKSESEIETDNEGQAKKFLQFDPTQDDNISIFGPENMSTCCDDEIVGSCRNKGLLGALPGFDDDEEQQDKIKMINWKKSKEISDFSMGNATFSGKSKAGLVKKLFIRRWGV